MPPSYTMHKCEMYKRVYPIQPTNIQHKCYTQRPIQCYSSELVCVVLVTHTHIRLVWRGWVVAAMGALHIFEIGTCLSRMHFLARKTSVSYVQLSFIVCSTNEYKRHPQLGDGDGENRTQPKCIRASILYIYV